MHFANSAPPSIPAGALRLATADIPQPEDAYFLPGYLQAWLMFLALLRTFAWEERSIESGSSRSWRLVKLVVNKSMSFPFPLRW